MAALATRALRPTLTISSYLDNYSSLATTLSPTTEAPVSLISSPAKIKDRDFNSVCGFWTSNEQTWSWWCPDGGPCQIDTYATPNLVFCTDSAPVPYTTWYPYTSWPAGGCSSQEMCCPATAPYPREHIFDSGATIWCQCEPNSVPISVTTHTGTLSVQLLVYAAAEITTTSAFQSTVSIPISSASQSATTTTITAQAATSGLSAGAKAGIGAGVGGIALALMGITLYWLRRQKSRGVSRSELKMPDGGVSELPLGGHHEMTELNVQWKGRGDYNDKVTVCAQELPAGDVKADDNAKPVLEKDAEPI